MRRNSSPCKHSNANQPRDSGCHSQKVKRMRPSKQQVDWLIYRNSMFRYINKGKDAIRVAHAPIYILDIGSCP